MSATTANASIHKDFPIPPDSTKAHCSVWGCTNRSEMIVVIDMPHRFLFQRRERGTRKMVDTAPSTATIALCRPCALEMAG